MRLSDYTFAYGDLKKATHILVQKCSNNNHFEYYGPREYKNQTYYFTRFLDSATYFTLDDFVENGFREIINNVYSLDKVFFRLINFGHLEPYELSKYELDNYIFKKPRTFSGPFSKFIMDVQDEIEARISKSIKNMQIEIESKNNNEPEEKEPIVIHIINKYDNTKTIDYNYTLTTDKEIIFTRGILEPYFSTEEINGYSKTLPPDETVVIPAQEGLRYTNLFDHPYKKGEIIKESTPRIIQRSIYTYFKSDIKHEKTNPNLTISDLNEIDNNEFEDYNDTTKNILNVFGNNHVTYKIYEPIEKGIKVINEPIIRKFYPNLEPGQIISKPKPRIILTPTNHIVKYIREVENLTDLKSNIAPTTPNNISIEYLLNNVLKSKLYNIPIKKVIYKAKWYNGVITYLDPKPNQTYKTPYQVKISNSNEPSEYYGVHIDISNVSKRTDIIDSLRTMLLNDIGSKTQIPTTISVHFKDRIIVKIEPFWRDYKKNKNVLYIQCDDGIIPDKSNFTKAKWNQLYSEWAKNHRDLIKSNQLNENLKIDHFWSTNKNDVLTDKRIEPPKDNIFICYINFHPESNDLKIGRSKSWESRYSLYTRANPPVKTIHPDCILRYYLKCPIHKDAVITEYLYACMEDFFKQFSDKKTYLKRHRTEKDRLTEYYKITPESDINNQLNQYVADLNEAFSNLTLKDLADVRKPAKNGDGIHGGKRQEFFNKINQETNEHIYNVEEALQIINNLDNITKFKDYPDFEKRFLPKFK